MGDEGVDGQPGVVADLDELVVGQDEVGWVEGGPSVVRREIVAEGKPAEEARRG
jgi:hypothetical protein